MKKSLKPIPYYINDFLDWLEVEKGLSSKTQENYQRFLQRFLNWLKLNKLENLKPHQLTPEHIRQYRLFLARQYLPRKTADKIKRALKRSTQNYYLIALRSLLNFFAETNILSLPPEKIKLARDKDERQVHFLALEQLGKLLSTPDISKIYGLRDRAILEVLFSTGMRIAELVALNQEQIRLKPDTRDLELVIIGKGDRPRTVYFSERAIKWLREYLNTRKEREKALFLNYRAKRGSSRRLSARFIEKKLKKYAISAGVPLTTTPHVLRHSFATDLLSQGVDLRTIQEFLGHKHIAATQIYAHVTSKRLREIHKKFHGGRKLK